MRFMMLRENMCELCWIARALIGISHDLFRVFCGVPGLEWEQAGFPLGNMWA